MNSRDIRVTFLRKFKLGRIAIKTADNINIAFEEGCVNVRTLQRWCAKFQIGELYIGNEPRGRTDGAYKDDNVSRKIIEYEILPHPPLFTRPFSNRPFLQTPEQFL
ncbi:Histone-lysine N-methyltransferase SETMAR [Habropoda laboriosa]|uniref:Histone-lysine N-methyltransferase SETMAR n=1 Tax=Habropoda laboriosa TaxID=597456 RepID=A0A0L7RK80_9HYME|nr:Histone-lysine N-methyltransferase SETMAR [Habropoda laboriosa]